MRDKGPGAGPGHEGEEVGAIGGSDVVDCVGEGVTRSRRVCICSVVEALLIL
jgi:hypothetical protein